MELILIHCGLILTNLRVYNVIFRHDHNIITIKCALGCSNKHHVKRYRVSYTVKYVHVLGKKA